MQKWIVRASGLLLIAYLAPPPLSAQYLDPGSSSILIQVLMGGVVGLAAVFKLYWGKIRGRRAKKAPEDGN
jgi:hypothetical protein